MDRKALLKTARADLAHAKAGTIQQMTMHYEVPADHYVDEERWQQEVDLIFKRLPLMLATTAELPNAHDYKAMTHPRRANSHCSWRKRHSACFF